MFFLSGCTHDNMTEQLNRFYEPEIGEISGDTITVSDGTTYFAQKDYTNFILTGQVLTEPDAEASLLFCVYPLFSPPTCSL